MSKLDGYDFNEPLPKDLPKNPNLTVVEGFKPLDLNKIADPNEEIDLVNDKWLGENITDDMIKALKPKLWWVIVKQVGIRDAITFKSGHKLILTDQAIEDQQWLVGMCVVVKVGPAVYKGRKYEEYGLTPEDGPQPGDVYHFSARNPKRYKVDGETFIEVPDDALTTEFNREQLHLIDFSK